MDTSSRTSTEDASRLSQLQHHEEKLKMFCRLCKNYINDVARIPVKASRYKRIISKIYNIDIDQDSEFVHPKCLCDRCRSNCNYYKKKSMQRKKLPKNRTAASFSDHKSDCEICSFSVRAPSGSMSTSGTPGPDCTSGPPDSPGKRIKIEVSQSDTPQPSQPKVQLMFATAPHPTGPSTSSIPAAPSAHIVYPVPTNLTVLGLQPLVKFVPVNLPPAVPPVAKEITDPYMQPAVSEESRASTVPVDSFQEQNLADALKCNLCLRVPFKPVWTGCGHIYCRPCLQSMSESRHPCTKCRSPVELHKSTDLASLNTAVYSALHVRCKHSSKGCSTALAFTNLEAMNAHESQCGFRRYKTAILQEPRQNHRGPGLEKIPIAEANRQYLKRERLKPVIEFLDQFCETHYESKIDILYFLLHNEIKLRGEHKRAKELWGMWQDSRDDETDSD